MNVYPVSFQSRGKWREAEEHQIWKTLTSEYVEMELLSSGNFNILSHQKWLKITHYLKCEAKLQNSDRHLEH